MLRVARELRKETEQFGVTSRQATLLAVVKASPGLTLRGLAEAEAISAPALSEQVDRLERAGLLRRLRSEVDRRRVGLELTPEGERLLRSIRERRTAWLAERLSALDPDALRAIEAAIGPLRELLEEQPLSSVTFALRTRTFRSLRRHYNYRLFFAGQVVSLAGSWMQNVALAWLVLSLSHSPIAVALLLFCRFVPYTLFGLFAGSVVDRFETRLLVIWTQAAAMLVSAALAFVSLTGTATLPVVYILATIGGIAVVLDAPGRQSLTFEMVGPRELPNAVALNSGLVNASRIVGPALAGIIIAVAGVGLCFIVNTISFLAVLAALLLMRTDELFPVAADRTVTLLKGTREGLAFAWHDRQVRVVLVVMTCVGLVGFNFNTLVPLLASDTLHVDARAFGLLSAAFGLGAFAGAIITASLKRATFRAFILGTFGFSVLLLVLAPVHEARLAGVVLVGIGASFTLFAANANALVQLAAPDHLRGRLVALYLFSFVGLAPLGSLLSGALVEVGGTELAFLVSGSVGLAATVFAIADGRDCEAPLERGSAA